MTTVPDIVVKMVCDVISKSLEDRELSKDMQYRLGYAKGVQDTIEHLKDVQDSAEWLLLTGQLRRE